ncbi:hypothetical protein Q9L58_010760 [Maublancomyces gigas]|uniref:Uncharacterized protein n=1 Tax=Discina gigas TaxID=1032678 RepID=A0ABR3G368_9PEZI
MDACAGTRMKERVITLHNISSKLPETFSADILSLTKGGDFKYLDDVVNRAKHRAILDFGYTLDMTAFERSGTVHPKRLVVEVLVPEVERQSRLFVEMGIRLNQWVSERITGGAGRMGYCG